MVQANASLCSTGLQYCQTSPEHDLGKQGNSSRQGLVWLVWVTVPVFFDSWLCMLFAHGWAKELWRRSRVPDIVVFLSDLGWNLHDFLDQLLNVWPSKVVQSPQTSPAGRVPDAHWLAWSLRLETSLHCQCTPVWGVRCRTCWCGLICWLSERYQHIHNMSTVQTIWRDSHDLRFFNEKERCRWYLAFPHLQVLIGSDRWLVTGVMPMVRLTILSVENLGGSNILGTSYNWHWFVLGHATLLAWRSSCPCSSFGCRSAGHQLLWEQRLHWHDLQRRLGNPWPLSSARWWPFMGQVPVQQQPCDQRLVRWWKLRNCT